MKDCKVVCFIYLICKIKGQVVCQLRICWSHSMYHVGECIQPAWKRSSSKSYTIGEVVSVIQSTQRSWLRRALTTHSGIVVITCYYWTKPLRIYNMTIYLQWHNQKACITKTNLPVPISSIRIWCSYLSCENYLFEWFMNWGPTNQVAEHTSESLQSLYTLAPSRHWLPNTSQ